MKHATLAALLLLAALASPAHPAPAQEEEDSEIRRLSRWMEVPGPVQNEELRRELLQMREEENGAPRFHKREP